MSYINENFLKLQDNYLFSTIAKKVAKSKQHYVFMIPVAKELDLKKCAQSVNEKNIEMIPQEDLLLLTGYIHGGCSPIGLKKPFKVIMKKIDMKLLKNLSAYNIIVLLKCD